MAEGERDELLEERLSAIDNAQRRTRVALFVTTLASCAILGVLWNAYLSWEAQWSELQEPQQWGQHVLVEQRIRSYQQSYAITIGALGIHLAAGDAAAVGSLVLLVMMGYLSAAFRAVNAEVGALLIENVDAPRSRRRRIDARIRSGMTLGTPIAGPPISALNDKTRRQSGVSLAWVVICLPLLTVMLAYASDFYFAFHYVSPFRENAGPAFWTLPYYYQRALLLGDAVAFICAAVIAHFTYEASRHHLATRRILHDFHQSSSVA